MGRLFLKAEAVDKADKACQLVCHAIAPNDGEALFQAVIKRYEECTERGIDCLLVAYQNAPSKSFKNTDTKYLFQQIHIQWAKEVASFFWKIKWKFAFKVKQGE